MATITLVSRAVLKSHDGYYLWYYLPSQPASIIMLIVFLALTLLNTWQMVKTKTWFVVVLVIGGFFEVLGYGARAAAYNETDQINPYVFQNIFILVAPACFAATIYMTLGRIIRMVHAEHLSPIRVTRLTKLFVAGDIASFWCQGMSAPLAFISNGIYAKWGDLLVLFGLLCQIVSFGIFWAVVVKFRSRIRLTPTEESLNSGGVWRPAIKMLYYVSALVMVRSIFRFIEYAQTTVAAFTQQASVGYLQSHEWPMYVFDSVLMALVMFIFFWWFPKGLVVKDTDDINGDKTELVSNPDNGIVQSQWR